MALKDYFIDYFNRITGLGTWGRSGEVERALAKCHPHPADPEVLVTKDPKGLYAIHDPHVKAVIWRRRLPEKLTSTLAKMSAESISKLNDTSTMDEADLEDMEQDPAMPLPLRRDVARLHSIAANISPVFTGHASSTFIGQRGFSSSSLLHSDDDGDGLTMHATYKRSGLEWFPGQFTLDQYEKLSQIGHSSGYPQGLRSEFTKVGEVIIFKGQNTNHAVPDDYLKGLLHRTPDNDNVPAKKHPPSPKSDKDRIVFVMF